MTKRKYRRHRIGRRQWPTDPQERAEFVSQTRREDNRRAYLELRDAIFSAYGRVCVCCKESIPEFLCLDHIDGGGHREHKEAGLGARLWRKLRRLGFPAGYRVLCYNCNNALAYYKVCPHASSSCESPLH